MKRRKPVTLADLSKELGLSVQTVSKALRGMPGMSEETRSAVIRAAYRCGYLYPQQAREMARQGIAPYPIFRLRFILVQSRESMNYNRLLLDGLRERFSQYDHHLDSFVLDEDLSQKAFEEWVDEHHLLHADGLFIAPRLISGRMESQLLALPIAKVLINYAKPLTQVDSVVWDVCEAVCQLADALIRCGHRRLLYVGDTHSQRGYVLRWQAYRDWVEGHEVEAQHTTVESFDNDYETYKPTAVVVGIDEDCGPVYRALHRKGVAIPAGCSLVGLVNEGMPDLPGLTRSLLMIKETAYRAADRMLWRIAHPNEPVEHTRVAGKFFAGETVRSLPDGSVQ
jgi:LacI family transcriptional regulator